MNWKNQLSIFEKNKKWDNAISLIEKRIAQNPTDVDAYIAINYLLMNLLVEEDYDLTKHDYYTALIKRYFTESFAKFSNNPKYLFFTSFTASMSMWYFGLELNEVKAMLQKASMLEPDNLIYQWTNFNSLDLSLASNKEKAIDYAKIIVEDNSPIKKTLEEQGAVGNCLLDFMTQWSNQVLDTKNSFNN